MPNGKKGVPYTKDTHGKPWCYDEGCRCDACTAAKLEYNNEWRAKNPGRKNKQDSDFKKRRNRREPHVDYRRHRWLKWRYGIAPGQFESMLEQQDHKCPICEEPLGNRPIDRHVDHDHATGKLRDILCRSCNHGLGGFKDDARRLRRAIAYLIKHSHLETPRIPGRKANTATIPAAR